jgi:hypothetical protein
MMTTPRKINWSVLVPPGGPAPVEAARKQVETLRAKIGEAHEQVETAKIALAQAEEHDRLQMSAAIRKGVAEPRSETAKIEALRAKLAEAERRAVATGMAVDDCEGELRAAVERSRAKWSRDVSERAETARAQARKKLDELASTLDELRELRGIVDWLGPDRGLDRAQAVRGTPPGYALSSRSASANSDPFSSDTLVNWLREVVDPAPRVAADTAA